MLEEKKRNVGIELFRILMMLGIVMTHVCGAIENPSFYLGRLFPTCVVGFAMISGYFGIRFAPSKLIRLYALAIGYWLLVPIMGGVMPCGKGYLVAVQAMMFVPADVWLGEPWYYGFLWYLHAYAVLMCIAPLLEERRMRHALPLLAVVFVWCFLFNFRHTNLYFPRPIGFSPFSFLTLLGIYLATRLARQNGWFEKIPVWILCGVAIISAAVIFVAPGASMYNSPITLVWMFALFSLFLKIRTLGKLNTVVCFLAPSMFGVYLLHGILYFPGISSNGGGLIKASLHKLSAAGIPLWANYILTLLAVFGISLAVDILRRLLLRPLMPKINAGLKRFDTAYQGFVERVFK